MPDYITVFPGDHTDRQNYRIKFVILDFTGIGIFGDQGQVFSLWVFEEFSGQPADIPHAGLFAADEQIFESFPESPDVHIKHGNFNIRVMILQEQTILDGIHTTDVTAIRVSDFAIGTGTDALDKGDPLGSFLVAGSDKMTFRGTTGRDQPLELHAGDNIIKTSITVFIHFSRIVNIHSGGNDHSAYIDFDNFFLHIEINTVLFTDVGTFTTGNRIMSEAEVIVQNINRWHSLGEGHVNCLVGGKSLLVIIGANYRANQLTFSTGITLIGIDEAGFFPHLHIEVADIATDVFYFAVSI